MIEDARHAGWGVDGQIASWEVRQAVRALPASRSFSEAFTLHCLPAARIASVCVSEALAECLHKFTIMNLHRN
jgi:hypothetical protein